MKKALILLACVALASGAGAQVTKGTFVFTRTVKIEMKFEDNGGNRPKMPDKIESDFELLFNTDKSMYRAAPEPEDVTDEGGGGGMRMMRFFNPGGAEIFCDFGTRMKTALHNVGDKSYVVTDSLEPQVWKMTNETKEILGHNCRKALTDRIITRMTMGNENGTFTRKEVKDTVPVEAWYAEDIPVPAGPEFAGTLPGMILEMSMDEGKFTYVATSYRKTYEKSALAPPKGEVITKDELKAKQEEFFKSFRGGGH